MSPCVKNVPGFGEGSDPEDRATGVPYPLPSWSTLSHTSHPYRRGQSAVPLETWLIQKRVYLCCSVENKPLSASGQLPTLKLFWTNLVYYCLLLYVISKFLNVIGRNCITWRSLNLAISLTRQYCLHCMSILPPWINIASMSSLTFLNNSKNHSIEKSKSQFFASCVYLSAKYGISVMK